MSGLSACICGCSGIIKVIMGLRSSLHANRTNDGRLSKFFDRFAAVFDCRVALEARAVHDEILL